MVFSRGKLEVREDWYALEAITIDAEPDTVVPALVELLHDNDGRVRAVAAHALEQIGPEANAAVPALVEMMQDDDHEMRGAANDALRRIHPNATAKAGIE